MNEKELKELHKLAWDFRALACEYWPTPNPVDSLRYAFTEAGEAMDAYLREHRPGDKRNRSKDADRLNEWADCAIMLLSALPGYAGPWWQENPVSDDELCLMVAGLLPVSSRFALDPEPPTDMDIAIVAGYVAAMPQIDLTRRVISRLNRIMYKHVPAWKWGEFTAVLGEGLTTPMAP